LLHCCCGPCSTASVEQLISLGYEITLFFGNSNIFPAEEADRRYEALERVAHHFGLPCIRTMQRHQQWLEAIKGLEAEPEGHRRCEKCFEWNLAEAKEIATTLGIDKFTTTLTISPHKRSATIFSVGQSQEGFVALDFKKKGGFYRSIELSEVLNLYRQSYCGCEFSMSRLLKKQQADGHDTHS